MEIKTATPADAFPADTQAEWVRGVEAARGRELLKQSQGRTDATQARLRDALIQAWRDMVEEASTSAALEVIAAEAHSLAEEFGSFSQQERYILAASLFGLSEDARKAGL